jgi:type I restriction enzyme S subunit
MIEDLKPYPQYKDSGSKWLSTVPSHWDVRKLRNLTRSRSERNRSDLPLLSVAREKGVFIRSLTDPNENHNVIPEDLSNYKVAHAGSLVINKMKAWQGSMGIAPIDGIVSPAYYVFDLDISNRLFAQALLRSKPYVALFAQASDGVRVGQWDLSITEMRAIPVLIPPPDEQAAIALFLAWATNRLDRAIGAKRRIIALLQEQKQAIIHRAVTRGLDPAVPLKDSGIPWLGEIPEHWEITRIKSLIREIDWRTSTGEEELLSLRMHAGLVPHNAVSSIPIASEALIGFKKVSTGQLVMNRMRAAIGMFGISERPGLVSPDYAVFEQTKPLCLKYLFALFQTPGMCRAFRVESKGLGTGASGFMRLYSDRFGAIRVPLPPLDEQLEIADAIKEQTSGIESIKKRVDSEITLLREYRTRLIADVVTGKLDVREVAKGWPEDELQDQPDVEAVYDAEEAEDDAESDPIDTVED